tara:strand:- start:553 stop:1023 length:471 start_codon:yes stop_codon:yes gene_type:complete
MVDEKSNSDNTFGNPESIEVMTEMYLSAVKSVLDSLKEYEKDSSESDIMFLLAQAQARWLSSALRYWQQIATIIGTRGIETVDAIKPDGAGASAEARRVRMLDKARAALREVSNLSLREAKLLQNDLVKIEADLRECVSSTEEDLDGPRRFAKITK